MGLICLFSDPKFMPERMLHHEYFISKENVSFQNPKEISHRRVHFRRLLLRKSRLVESS